MPLLLQLRNGIIPARTERVTPRDTANRQPRSTRRAVLADGFDGVRGATRKITTRGGQKLAEADLIAPHGEDEEGSHNRPYVSEGDSLRIECSDFSRSVRNRRRRV